MPNHSQLSQAKFNRLDMAIRTAMLQNEAALANSDPDDTDLRDRLVTDYDALWGQRREAHELRKTYVMSNLQPSAAEKRLTKRADDAKDWVDSVNNLAKVLKTVGKIAEILAKLTAELV